MTVSIIRSTLWSLYFKRRHTINRLREGGRNMKLQIEALRALKVQLEVSEHWTLTQHVAMVAGLKNEIGMLITVCLTKEKSFRSRVLDLLNECTQQHRQPTLFT